MGSFFIRLHCTLMLLPKEVPSVLTKPHRNAPDSLQTDMRGRTCEEASETNCQHLTLDAIDIDSPSFFLPNLEVESKI